MTCFDYLQLFDASNAADLFAAAALVLGVAWGFRVLKRALFS